MIEREFIPYQQSIDMKELGFNEPCLGLYHNDKTFYPTQCKSHEEYHGQVCSAPLYQQAFRFFREKYKLNAFIRGKVFDGYIYEIDGLGLLAYKFEVGGVSNTSYEQVELDALNKLIEITKSGSLKA
jgi:hypothetical protein